MIALTTTEGITELITIVGIIVVIGLALKYNERF